ncbi:hypothetical protein ACOBQB_10150 [Streptomyces sp. G5(2025)]|uniref:hypothetical protein n=1 Tax=Streptomyces sp. G5(2025) TaxID=3406628 RepID=UPI003C2366FD
MDDVLKLLERWEEQDTRGTTGDVTGPVEELADRAEEPRHTLALACSSAASSASLGRALENRWALHIPQHAAVVAAGIHATLRSSVENLHRLRRTVEMAAARGDLKPSGSPTPDAEGFTDALDRLTAVADEVSVHLKALAPAVHALHATPATFQVPRTVHETMTAVAAILKDTAELRTWEDGHQEEATEDGCGCTLFITFRNERYLVSYDDFEGWSVMRESVAAVSRDGSMTWTNPPSAGVKDPLAHPGRLAEAIMKIIQNGT